MGKIPPPPLPRQNPGYTGYSVEPFVWEWRYCWRYWAFTWTAGSPIVYLVCILLNGGI